jgi:cobalt/nickel transport system permease protein
MHIPPGLLSLPVALGSGAVAAGAVAVAAARCRKTLDEQMVPVVGVLGAFTFAAQMVNFPIASGTSGHLVGGFLLGVLFGWAPALVTMAAILIVQCLVFADGGLDALGANIINMGLVSCLLGGLVRRLSAGRHGRLSIALTACGAWFAVVLGAAVCVGEVWLSGRLETRALLLAWTGSMIGVHALIGIVEGAITAMVVVYVAQTGQVVGLAQKEAAQ